MLINEKEVIGLNNAIKNAFQNKLITIPVTNVYSDCTLRYTIIKGIPLYTLFIGHTEIGEIKPSHYSSKHMLTNANQKLVAESIWNDIKSKLTTTIYKEADFLLTPIKNDLQPYVATGRISINVHDEVIGDAQTGKYVSVYYGDKRYHYAPNVAAGDADLQSAVEELIGVSILAGETVVYL